MDLNERCRVLCYTPGQAGMLAAKHLRACSEALQAKKNRKPDIRKLIRVVAPTHHLWWMFVCMYLCVGMMHACFYV